MGLAPVLRLNADLLPSTPLPICKVSLAALRAVSFVAEKFRLAFPKVELLIAVLFNVALLLSRAATINKDAAARIVNKPNEYKIEFFI